MTNCWVTERVIHFSLFFYNFSIYLFVFPSCCCCWFIFVSFLGFLTWGTEGNRERENVVAVVAVVAVGERSRKQMKFSNKEWRRSERSDPHPLHVRFNRIKLIDKDNRRRTLNERMVIGCDDDANVPPLLSVSSDSFGAGWGEGREKEREEEEGEEEGGGCDCNCSSGRLACHQVVNVQWTSRLAHVDGREASIQERKQ